MRKLKVALTLLFAMSFSLFLFACGGSKGAYQDAKVEGGKTTFAEGEAFSAGDLVVKVLYTGDDADDETKWETVALDKCSIDSSAYKNDTPGIYMITVTPNPEYQDANKTGESTAYVTVSYEVEVVHAWGDKDADGYQHCPCGARQLVSDINDTVKIEGWGTAAQIGAGNKAQLSDKHATYGSIGIGQSITVKGKGKALDNANTYYFPITGIRKGSEGVVVRNDSWTIYEGPGGAFTWPNHSAGADATTGAIPDDAAEWDIYQVGTTSSTADYANEVDIELYWNYRTDGVMEWSINNITRGRKITRYMKVPAATYEAVLYGEQFEMTLTQLTIVENLQLSKWTMDTAPTQTVYAENTFFNEEGLKTTAVYNEDTAKELSSVITTYDLLADIVNGQETKTYNLRTTPLSAVMTNFRIEFGGKKISLDGITVKPSYINGVYNMEFQGLASENATFSYGVDASGNVAVFANGTPGKLSEEQKTGLHTTKDYYVIFRLIGVGNQFNGVKSSDSQSMQLFYNPDDNTVYALVLVDAQSTDKTITFTNEPAEGDAVDLPNTVKVSLAGLDLTNVATKPNSYLSVNNQLTIDAGGTVEVVFENLPESKNNLYFGAGGSSVAYDKLHNAAKDATTGILNEEYQITRNQVYITRFKEEGNKITVAYKIMAPNLAGSFTAQFPLFVREGSNNLTQQTVAYSFTMSESAEGFMKIQDNVYLKSEGNRLYVIALFQDNALTTDLLKTNVQLNIQNETAEVFDLSVSVNAAGVASFKSVNTVTKSTATDIRTTIVGTINSHIDWDTGVAVVVRADLKALGLRPDNNKAQKYYFEDAATGNIYSVTDNTILLENIEIPENRDGGVDGDCIVDTLRYYQLKEGNTVVFKYGQISILADGAHNFVEGVCSKCGTHRFATTEAGMTVAAIADKDIATRGITLDFDVDGATNDWTSAFLTTKGNMIITLPNLDPWNNTLGFAQTNLFPGADNLFNGGAYNSFLNCKAHVTVTISPVSGITYYKNGVKMIQYPAISKMGDGSTTVEAFVNKVLEDVAANEWTFAAGEAVGKVSNLTVYTAALDELGVLDSYYAALGATITHHTDLIVGTPTLDAAWWTANAVPTQKLTKGSTVIFYGTQETNAINNWNSLVVELTNGWCVRSDAYGWVAGDGILTRDEATWETHSITPAVEEEWGDDSWTAFRNLIKNESNFTVSLTWAADDTITIEMALWNESGKYTVTYTLGFAENKTAPEDGFSIVFASDSYYAEISRVAVIAPAAE